MTQFRDSDDLMAAEIVRQSRPAGMGSRLQAASGGAAPAQNPATTSTRIDAGDSVRRLWIPGFDPFDAPGYYFGDAPINDGFEG